MTLWGDLRELGRALHDAGRTVRAMWGFNGVQLSPEMDAISYNSEAYPIEGVRAWVEPAAWQQTYPSAAAMIGGGFLAGGIGVVAGSLYRKQATGTGGFFIVQGPGFQWIVEFDSRAEFRAREFAAQVTQLGSAL